MKRENFFGYEKYSFGSGALSVSVVTLGAAVTELRFAGRNMVLCYPDAAGYLDGTAYICAAIGRYANRIAGARFTLNGREYVLPANEGANQLHGGPDSYDKRRWEAEVLGDDSVRFTLHSPDGDNGFPGNLTASVTYTVSGDTLRLDFGGVSDADTVYAPTSHMYFNLDGSSALDHSMRIDSAGWLEVDGGLIPTGRVMPPEGDFDFHALRRVTRDYDHCFVMNGEHACTVEAGGVRMDVFTDFPAMQVYTSSGMGAPHGKNAGLAIEPEFYPDSPNHPDFPSTVLHAGEHFHRYAEYKFSKI